MVGYWLILIWYNPSWCSTQSLENYNLREDWILKYEWWESHAEIIKTIYFPIVLKTNKSIYDSLISIVRNIIYILLTRPSCLSKQNTPVTKSLYIGFVWTCKLK